MWSRSARRIWNSRRSTWFALGVLAVALVLGALGVLAAARRTARPWPVLSPASSDYAYPLSGGYQLARSSAYRVRVVPVGAHDPEEVPSIPPEVVEIAWDRAFILARQRPLNTDSGEPARSGGPNYWILDVSVPKRYGPFDQAEFERKRAELGVSRRLELRAVGEYRR